LETNSQAGGYNLEAAPPSVTTAVDAESNVAHLGARIYQPDYIIHSVSDISARTERSVNNTVLVLQSGTYSSKVATSGKVLPLLQPYVEGGAARSATFGR